MDFFLSILKNLPDGAALGLVWGIMAIGVYITFKILDIPDMTVDGTFALGGCMIAATRFIRMESLRIHCACGSLRHGGGAGDRSAAY